MNCPKCSDLMVDAQATNHGEVYKYCRTCKMDLAEVNASMPKVINDIPCTVRDYTGLEAYTYKLGSGLRGDYEEADLRMNISKEGKS